MLVFQILFYKVYSIYKCSILKVMLKNKLSEKIKFNLVDIQVFLNSKKVIITAVVRKGYLKLLLMEDNVDQDLGTG